MTFIYSTMRWLQVFLPLALLVCLSSHSDAARILGLFQFQAKSHFVMFEVLMKGLAAKGHEVVVVSHFPQKNKVPNYTDRSIKGSVPELVNNFTVEFVRNFGYLNLLEYVWDITGEFCKLTLEHPVHQDLIKNDEKFDLVITEIFGVDCCLGFAHKFNVPVIGIMSSVAIPWVNDRFGNPDNPSYIANYFLQYQPDMTFTQRLINSVFYVFTKVGHYYRAELPTDVILKKHFGNDLPPLSELTNKMSLVFANSHYSINMARPLVPAFIEVAGLHINPPKKLPQDIEKFLNDAPHGVIYFSFGSLVQAETLPKDKIQSFVEAFRELPQHVLWKCNGSEIDLPPNVKTSTWLPQFDILSHPNVRVFITHGGLMGTLEGVHTGVPMLGIPLFSDQKANTEETLHKGVAVKLEYDSITKETVLNALKTLTGDPSYRERAKHLSQLFRDRPQTALETAVYWCEYVIRHGGAPHLRSAAVDLPLYQYLLLDVIAVLLLAVTAVLGTLVLIVRKLISCFVPAKKNQAVKRKQKSN